LSSGFHDCLLEILLYLIGWPSWPNTDHLMSAGPAL
jgi:hypothetical protein